MWKVLEAVLFLKELKTLIEIMSAKLRIAKKKEANREAIQNGDPTILECALSGDCVDGVPDNSGGEEAEDNTSGD